MGVNTDYELRIVIRAALVARLAFITAKSIALIAGLAFITKRTSRIRRNTFFQLFNFQSNFLFHFFHLLQRTYKTAHKKSWFKFLGHTQTNNVRARSVTTSADSSRQKAT